MAYYKPCPECGASLDPGEVCECNKKMSAPAATDNGHSKTIQLKYTTGQGRKSRKNLLGVCVQAIHK